MTAELDQQPNAAADTQAFLNPERIREVGAQIAPLIRDQLSWIERRKESVQILDDTALRRHISVDFSLRSSSVKPLLPAEAPGQLALYCAPLFVLPKLSGGLMAFDLRDGDGNSLRLISREDNAKISAAALTSMVEARLGETGSALPSRLRDRLRDLALSEHTATAERIAQRLVAGSVRPWDEALAAIRDDERLCWWIKTLAHSSIVVVLYRAVDARRKLIKLSFEEPFDSAVRVLTRLGWEPYQVAIDSPLIEARSYHIEVTAPPGLRIASASLTDAQKITGTDPDRANVRRVHLYRPRAGDARAGTAYLRLAVSGPGFVGGGFLAALLTVLALLACAVFAGKIAGNPTSAPALLLVLPGLIASYVGRSDQHALTTRLLAGARYALLLSAFWAYVAAARVALDGGAVKGPAELRMRTSSLREWLYVLATLSCVSLAVLGVTFVRARVRIAPLRAYLLGNRVNATACIAMRPGRVLEHLREMREPRLLPEGYDLVEDDGDRLLRYAKEATVGARVVTCVVEDADEDCVLDVTVDFLSWVPGQPVLPRTALNAKIELDARLASFSAWAGGSSG